jgi:uncharacterized protein DUF11/putative Ig domain-containing protein
VLAVVDTTATRTNPVSITLYSTRPSDPRTPIAPPQTDLPPVTIVLSATPTNYTALLAGVVTPLRLAPNTAAAGCAAPTDTADAGGASQDTPPQFTSKTPPLNAVGAVPYTYTFHAVGSPDPTFSLDPFAPSWLTIDSDTGVLTGAVPLQFVGAFTYTVTASNRASFDVAGPFEVTVSPPPPPQDDAAAFGHGPFVADGEPAIGRDAVVEQTPAPPPAVPSPIATTLLLPNGRGRIQLPSDVTPGVSTFTYTETDDPTGALGELVFGGLDFTIAAVDAATGAGVATLVDPPLATIVLRPAELDAARIRDRSRLGLYWWSGIAWVNQLPCAGCGVAGDGSTLTALLTQPGEYVLAATPPPAAQFTIAPQPIQAIAGQAFAGQVATFPPAVPLDGASDYAAMIEWGDGQESPGTVSARSGGFSVTGAHTWAAAGTYPVAITIVDGGDTGTAQASAVVAPVEQAPQFTAATPPATATAGVTYAYTFAASGVPAPGFALVAGAPSWLTIGAASGQVSGTPPPGTTSFTFSVVASNGVGPDAVAGPFAVTVAAAANTSADLAIAISAPASATKGSTATYTIVVTNKGPAAAFNGALLLVAGPDASLVSATPQPLIRGAGFWTWRFGTLDPGASAAFTVNLKLSRAGTVLALGTVAADTRDPKLANNVALVATKVK